MASNTKSVNEIIDSLMIRFTLNEDSYLSNVSKYLIQEYARLGVREITEKHTAQVKGLRISVTDSNSIALPHDYVGMLRVSELTTCGTLIPIAVNMKMSVASAYLLDNLDRIMLNSNDVPILSSGDSGIDRTCSYSFDYSTVPYYADSENYTQSATNSYMSINNTFSSGVTYKEDLESENIQFSGRQLDEVVLEYTYNPVSSIGDITKLTVHELFADALEKWIYNEIVSQSRNVQPYEKSRAEKALRKSLLEAKLSKNGLKVYDLISVTNLK